MMNLDSIEIRTGAWDVHVHLLDPIKFPYKQDRVYTPPAASFEQLAKESKATHFMIVQATVEVDAEGVLSQLRTLSQLYPDRTFRGTLNYSPNEKNINQLWSDRRLAELHELGVRCLRVHGRFGGISHDQRNAVMQVQELLRGEISTIARKQHWAISMNLPLSVWAELRDFIKNEMAGISIIVEHCGSIRCPMSPDLLRDFEILVEMLKAGLVYIKLGALHRRTTNIDARSMEDIGQLIRRIGNAGPDQILWGSDWPHVNAAATGLAEAPFLPVDVMAELQIIHRSLPDGAFENMLHHNPTRLLGT